MMKMNPREILANFMSKNQNPMFNNLINMAQKGDSKGVENFARNLFKERGRDFDKEFAEFMGKMKR
jgi:hypothetical protein